MATTAMGMENFFTTTLSSSLTDSGLTISLNAVPTASEGYLVIDPDNASKREVIYYTSKGASSVTVPASGGRGADGTTAVSHDSGATVEMNMVAGYWEDLQSGEALADGAVTANKLATANYQVWAEAATGTAETSGTSYTTAHSFATDMEIPTWATKVVLTWHVASLSVTSTTDGVFRLSLGTGDTTSDERVQFSTYPIGTVEHATFINEVTLSGTGTQSLTLQFREAAGSGAIRVTTSCRFHVKAEYY